MSPLRLVPPVTDVFSISVQQAGDLVLVAMTGEIGLPQGPALTAFLDSLHDEAVRIAAAGVTVDLTRLLFVNSNGLRLLANWIARARNSPQGRPYGITLVRLAGVDWQERAAAALASLAPDVRVEP